MKRSFNTTLILAGFLVVVIAWYLGYEKKLKVQHEKAEEKAKQLVDIDRLQIQDVTLARLKNPPADNADASKPAPAPEYETIQLKKVGTDWAITAPIDYAADMSVVDGVLTTLTTSKSDRVVDENPKDLDIYGLKNPLIKVTMRKDSKSPALEVSIGKDTPTGSNNYAKTGDSNKVYRVTHFVKTSADKDLKALRNKVIIDVPRPLVAEVEIQSPKENIILKKDLTKDTWTLSRDGVPADTGEWNKTLNAILDLKAQDFPAEKAADLSKFGLKSPTVKVTIIQVGDKGKVGLWLGSVKDKTYAKREDRNTVFEVEKEILTKTQLPSSTYVDKHIASFNRFDTKRIKIERGKNVAELLKDNGKWTFPSEPGVPIDTAKVDGFLSALQDLKVAKFLKGEKPLAQGTALTISIFEAKEKAPEEQKLVLKFGAPKGKEVLGEKIGGSAPFAISDADWKKISLGKSDFTQPETKKTPDAKSAPDQKTDKKSR